MKPEFEKYRGEKGEKRHPVNVAVPLPLRDLLEFVATEESDSFSGIVIEGLGRVIEDRQSDPEFTVQFLAHLDERSQSIEEARQRFLGTDQ
ncbi:MAG TPA: hypothetical protein VMR28_00055 [Candidatus Saccharimonadales bacterium]|nr:hypothetical protein [Candidatus Saccharimonadales bacterium]